jgi:VWFA-related protein
MFFMPLLLIVLLAVPGALRAQERTSTFRAGVALVKVDARVAERDGRAIRGLGAADFQVFDENEPQKIVHFGREAEPLDLVLLLDASGSMRRRLGELAATARAALGPLGAQDRVAVIVFAREAAVREELTGITAAVEREIRDAVRDQTLGSGTVINANIIFAAEYLARQPVRGQRAILIVTDNQGLNYQVPDEDVIRQLYAADAVLNAILFGRQRKPDPVRPGRYVNPDFTPSDVFKLARETGGEARESREAARSFGEMIEGIRSRYSLQYAAPADAAGRFHRIRVELAPAARKRYPDAAVYARAGYFSAPGP